MLNEKIRNVSIKKRLILGFSIIPILSMIFLFFICVKQSKIMIKNNMNDYSTEMLNIIDENIDLNIEKFEQQLDEVLMSPLIYYGLRNSNVMTAIERHNFSNKLNNFLYSKLHLLSSAGEVEILTKDLSILYTQGFKYFNKNDVLRYTFMAKQNIGKTIWFHTQIDGQGVISMARAIKDPLSKNILGYIFVALNEQSFTKSFLNKSLNNSTSTIILDENNKYLFGELPVNYKEKIELQGDKTIIGDIRYISKYKNVEKFDWKVVTLINYSSFLKQLINVIIVLGIVVLIFTIFFIIISKYIYRSIYIPIYKLSNCMESFIEGKFKTKLIDNSKDEIGTLSRQFNSLVEEINSLIIKVKYEQTLKRKSEINMLQAQINPHFLFNTLNTLKWIAIMNEDMSVSDGLNALAKLLRNTIVNSNEFITIREEIDNIKNYIVIQKLRYGDSFDVNYNICEKDYNKKIIKFILQPIIENSILHGFDEDKEGQKIDIEIKSGEKFLEITIKDNGKGFDYNNKSNEGNGKLSGVGYKNVYERIKLTYGKKAKVELKSKVLNGTCVKIILPNNFDEDGVYD